jgi:hypothetical protein
VGPPRRLGAAAMTATAALQAGRALAEALMLDTCVIERESGTTTDPDTGDIVTTWATVYTGRAKVQTYEAQESNPDAGGSIRTSQRYTVHIPVGSYEPEVGDRITITAAATDPHIVGRKYRVAALLHKTLATAYRLGVEDGA